MTFGWLILGLAVAFAWAAVCQERRRARSERCWQAWEERLRAGTPSGWAEPEHDTVISHVTADGEVVDYPVIRGETLDSLATTLGQIASLPEVAA